MFDIDYISNFNQGLNKFYKIKITADSGITIPDISSSRARKQQMQPLKPASTG